jgi:hypothetical protein
MFNLDEALRNHLAQRQKEPKARFVAASVRDILMRYAAHMREQVNQGNVGIATAQNRLLL